MSHELETHTFDAPAKINLTLKVIGRRDDGYHQIESIVAFSNLVRDRIIVRASNTMQLRVSGPFANHLDGTNLITAAVRAVADSNPSAMLADIDLEKNIPVAAGLGGGSADAAATLRALQIINRDIADNIDWSEIAIRLGADVPVCLEGKLSRISGIGENIEPLASSDPCAVVLVNTKAPVPANKTAQVFSRLSARSLTADANSPTTVTENLWDVIQATGNDLQPAAVNLMPDIRLAISAIENTKDCLLARLSGAGPTCFGLYRTTDGANAASAQIQQEHPTWWVASSGLK